MHVISERPLRQFWNQYPDAEKLLKAWLSICKNTDFKNFAHLKRTFGSVDKVGKHVVFDIRGNKFRLIVVIHFDRRRIYVRAVLTHDEYDQDHWKNE